MNVVEVSNIAKSFGDVQAVQDASFNIEKGEIFGLLGPNGAGKTTTIRIMLDIFKPDRGTVSILDGPMSEEKKARIGYMPEERGLYQDIKLEDCLLYLATLKGVQEKDALARLEEYLERFDLTEYKKKKIKELSKGMQQKAQIINTILHQPELLIIDEPFNALDPVNVQLVKDLMLDLRDQGVTIIMSTHQMHLVEELCNRILLINKGKNVLHGVLGDIQNQFKGNAVIARIEGNLPVIQGVHEVQSNGRDMKLLLDEGTTPQEIFQELAAKQIALEKFEVAIPSLDEIFIRVVEGGK